MEYRVKEVSLGTEYSSGGTVVKVQTTAVDGGQSYVYEVFLRSDTHRHIDRAERGQFFSDRLEAACHAISLLEEIHVARQR
jgi:hypothetical protein